MESGDLADKVIVDIFSHSLLSATYTLTIFNDTLNTKSVLIELSSHDS